MKLEGLILCGIAGALAGYFGGIWAVVALVIGEIGIMVFTKKETEQKYEN